MRSALTLTIILAFLTFSYMDYEADRIPSNDEGLVIEMSPEVRKVTNNIAQSFSNEVSMCLSYSKVDNNTILIDDYYIPETKLSTNDMVLARACEGKYTISWHNHPRDILQNGSIVQWWSFMAVQLDSPDKLLYLSTADIEYVLEYNIEYAIVASEKDNWAWWSKEQVIESDKKIVFTKLDNQHYKK